MRIEIKQDIKLSDFVTSHFSDISLSKARKMILYGCFYIDNAAVKSPEYILHKGDVLEYRKYTGGRHLLKEKRNVRIFYEDRSIIVADKLSFQKVRDNKSVETVEYFTRKYLNGKYHKSDLYFVFYPESDESGLCLMVKDKYLLRWFENNGVYRKSAVVLYGELNSDGNKIEAVVEESNGIYKIGGENSGNTECVTFSNKFQIPGTNEKLTYAEIEREGKSRPYLDRFILSSKGNTVYGDRVFGSKKYQDVFLRYCVYCIEFKHPVTHKKIRIERELPGNFKMNSARNIIKQ